MLIILREPTNFRSRPPDIVLAIETRVDRIPCRSLDGARGMTQSLNDGAGRTAGSDQVLGRSEPLLLQMPRQPRPCSEWGV